VKSKLAKKNINWTPIIITIILVGTVAAAGGIGYYVWTHPTIDPNIPIDPTLGSEVTTTFNGEKTWNVPVDIYFRDLYSPDFSVIGGLDIYIYAYGTAPSQLAAQGISIEEATLLDSFTTDSSGKGRSTRNFAGNTLLTCVAGLDSSANKSMLKDFRVQGLTQDTQPGSIDCGIFYYKKMAEETATTFTWTDAQGSTITTWNYTADTDGIFEGKIKLVMSTSGQSLRDIWSRAYGDLSLMMAVKVTHKNCTSSAAIDVESAYDQKGTPNNQLVFAFYLEEIIYEVTSTGAIQDNHESYRYFTVKLDFTGCGFVDGSATDHQLTIGGWALVEQGIDQVPGAGLPSGDSANWFQKALGSLTIFT